MGQKAVDAYSYSAYLAMEAEAELKHEYHDGLITALAGGTPVHGQLAANFGIELGIALKDKGKSCRTYSSDTRIRIDATNRAYYPDFSVVCEQPLTSPDDQHAITNPILILEVLSESTAGFDRGTKFSHYRQIDSLREYVLISQEKAMVDTAPLTTMFYEAASEPKELFEVPGASHVSLYDIDRDVNQAVERMDAFFQKY